MKKSDIDNRFWFHPASDEEKQNAHGSVRVLFLGFAHELNDRLPEGREKELVVTKLEEAMFWSNAALARDRGGAE